jgi:hypothetical protein
MGVDGPKRGDGRDCDCGQGERIHFHENSLP